MNRGLLWLQVAVSLGWWSTNTKAVCINKDGVSYDPSQVSAVPWRSEFREAAVVLIGTVVSQKSIPDTKEPTFSSGTLYTLKVEALLKGNVGASVQVFSPNDSGRLYLTAKSRYLLFLHEEGGHLTTDSCGNSAKLVYP